MKKVKQYYVIIIVVGAIALTAGLYVLNKRNPQNFVKAAEAKLISINREINEKEADKKIVGIDSAIGKIFSERRNPVLVLRLKEIYCMPCVDNELNILKSVYADLKNQIIILVSESNERFIRRLFLKHEIKISYIEIPFDALSGFSFENHEAPYYFLLHDDFHVSHIWLPIKEAPHLTVRYLKSIQSFL
jgi:hypothetical protein